MRDMVMKKKQFPNFPCAMYATDDESVVSTDSDDDMAQNDLERLKSYQRPLAGMESGNESETEIDRSNKVMDVDTSKNNDETNNNDDDNDGMASVWKRQMCTSSEISKKTCTVHTRYPPKNPVIVDTGICDLSMDEWALHGFFSNL